MRLASGMRRAQLMLAAADHATARGARRWNDANVLGLSLRLTTTALAGEVVDAFLSEPFDPSEQRFVDRLA